MPFRRSVRAFAALLLCALANRSVWGGQDVQAPPLTPEALAVNPNAKRYTVTGTVFNTVTNEPIRRVLVHLNGGPEPRVAFTGADGRFEIANVLEGPVSLSAERPGYFDPRSLDGGAQFVNQNSTPRVGPGTNDFRLFLVPESKIVGTVLDSEGEPVEGVTVTILGQQIMEGRAQWMSRGAAQTDENGVYRLDNQMPGLLLVCTAPKSLDPFERRNSDAYAARCYPNAPDRESAQPIDLQSGQTAHADFSVELVRTYSVSGVITGGRGRVQGFVQQEGNDGFGSPVEVNPGTGRFVVRSLPSGTWKLHLQSNEGDKFAQTVQEVTVNGADVTGLQIPFVGGADIPIEIVGPKATASAFASSGRIRLIPAVGFGSEQYLLSRTPNTNGEPNADPTLALQNVQPGNYSVTAHASPGCVASVICGGVDLAREPLIVSAGTLPQPLAVTVRDDCALLNVNVQAESKDTQAWVLVIADSPLTEPQIMSAQSGSATQLGSLSPGTYHVYAVTNVGGLAYSDPSAMRDIPSQTLTLDANAKAEITVPLYERAKK